MLISILGLTSCSAAWKVGRASKLLEEAIAQGAEVKADTVMEERRVDVHGAEAIIILPRVLLEQKMEQNWDTVYFQDSAIIELIARRDFAAARVVIADSTIVLFDRIITRRVATPPPRTLWKEIVFGIGATVGTLELIFFLLRLF
jgi:hypothetical protein